MIRASYDMQPFDVQAHGQEYKATLPHSGSGWGSILHTHRDTGEIDVEGVLSLDTEPEYIEMFVKQAQMGVLW